jgi:hypothetical protein
MKNNFYLDFKFFNGYSKNIDFDVYLDEISKLVENKEIKRLSIVNMDHSFSPKLFFTIFNIPFDEKLDCFQNIKLEKLCFKNVLNSCLSILDSFRNIKILELSNIEKMKTKFLIQEFENLETIVISDIYHESLDLEICKNDNLKNVKISNSTLKDLCLTSNNSLDKFIYSQSMVNHLFIKKCDNVSDHILINLSSYLRFQHNRDRREWEVVNPIFAFERFREFIKFVDESFTKLISSVNLNDIIYTLVNLLEIRHYHNYGFKNGGIDSHCIDILSKICDHDKKLLLKYYSNIQNTMKDVYSSEFIRKINELLKKIK